MEAVTEERELAIIGYLADLKDEPLDTQQELDAPHLGGEVLSSFAAWKKSRIQPSLELRSGVSPVRNRKVVSRSPSIAASADSPQVSDDRKRKGPLADFVSRAGRSRTRVLRNALAPLTPTPGQDCG